MMFYHSGCSRFSTTRGKHSLDSVPSNTPTCSFIANLFLFLFFFFLLHSNRYPFLLEWKTFVKIKFSYVSLYETWNIFKIYTFFPIFLKQILKLISPKKDRSIYSHLIISILLQNYFHSGSRFEARRFEIVSIKKYPTRNVQSVKDR